MYNANLNHPKNCLLILLDYNLDKNNIELLADISIGIFVCFVCDHSSSTTSTLILDKYIT